MEDINSLNIDYMEVNQPQEIVSEIYKYMTGMGKEERNSEERDPKTIIKNKDVEQENERKLINEITIDEIKEAVKKIKRGKAQGPDSILA